MKNGFPADKMALLPNFMNADHPDIHIKTGKNENPLYIGFAGRLNRQKGFDTLSAAMQLIPDIRLQAAGEADKEYIQSLILPDNIIIHGKLNKEDMDIFWSEIRFLVFTSASYEGFPMVFLEAMKQKLPIIAPRMAAYPEIIEDHVNGLLYEPGDSNDLALKIRQLWEDQDLCRKLGENGFQKLIEKYSSEVYYKGLIEIYNKKLNN